MATAATTERLYSDDPATHAVIGSVAIHGAAELAAALRLHVVVPAGTRCLPTSQIFCGELRT
jgi:hypothetical protein